MARNALSVMGGSVDDAEIDSAMEHSVTAPTEGTVTEIGVTVAQQVDLGAVLAVVEES